MNARFFAASAIALTSFLSAVSPAAAQTASVATGPGHYEWRVAPSFGPKAPIRVWVAPPAATKVETAECDCKMMQHEPSAAVACMEAMPSTSSDAHGHG